MNEKKTQTIITDNAAHANLGNISISLIMNSDCIKLKPNYTVKGTIETFRVHHLSGAPIVDFQNKVIGVISEYDLLIQAATKSLSETIDYKSNVISALPESTLKEVLIIFYKQKLKWLPVVNKGNFLQGVVTRIDILNYIATHSSKD